MRLYGPGISPIAVSWRLELVVKTFSKMKATARFLHGKILYKSFNYVIRTLSGTFKDMLYLHAQ